MLVGRSGMFARTYPRWLCHAPLMLEKNSLSLNSNMCFFCVLSMGAILGVIRCHKHLVWKLHVFTPKRSLGPSLVFPSKVCYLRLPVAEVKSFWKINSVDEHPFLNLNGKWKQPERPWRENDGQRWQNLELLQQMMFETRIMWTLFAYKFGLYVCHGKELPGNFERTFGTVFEKKLGEGTGGWWVVGHIVGLFPLIPFHFCCFSIIWLC